MEIDNLMLLLQGKGTKEAFEALKQLEKISDTSNILYKQIDKFFKMISDKKYVIRVRGFRLFCKQARWDVDGYIDKNIEVALSILDDEKPTAVRQALAALQEVIIYKKELRNVIKASLEKINCHKYKETVSKLIEKDIQVLLTMLSE